MELEDSRKSESECEETTERPEIVSTTLFKKEQRYHWIIPPSSNAPLKDITMSSNDSSRIDSEVQNSSPLTSKYYIESPSLSK